MYGSCARGMGRRNVFQQAQATCQTKSVMADEDVPPAAASGAPIKLHPGVGNRKRDAVQNTFKKLQEVSAKYMSKKSRGRKYRVWTQAQRTCAANRAKNKRARENYAKRLEGRKTEKNGEDCNQLVEEDEEEGHDIFQSEDGCLMTQFSHPFLLYSPPARTPYAT